MSSWLSFSNRTTLYSLKTEPINSMAFLVKLKEDSLFLTRAAMTIVFCLAMCLPLWGVLWSCILNDSGDQSLRQLTRV